MRKFLCLAFLQIGLLFLSLNVHAQDRTVTGVVTGDNGLPVNGATVKVKGKTVLTQTDAAGRFSLRASSSDVLEVTHVSFATFEITVGDASNIPIFLKSKEGTLGEVVVTSLGIRKAKRELGYTVTEVKGEEVEQTQRDNFLMALAG